MNAPSWSLDSRRIVASGPQGLWVINVATGAAREILSFGRGRSRRFGVVTRQPLDRVRSEPIQRGVNRAAAGQLKLWLVRPDGSGLRQLTHLTGANDPGAPAWSPDGRRLAFTYRSRSNWPVATIRANGTGLRTLFTRGLQNYGIDWSR